MIVKILNIMTVTKNELNQQNIFAQEPTMYIAREDMERFEEKTYAERAELANSHWAMIGVISGLISYAISGKLFFGVI
jgi:hypothetical protein